MMACEPGSYVLGVPVRISEAFRPPRKVTLNASCSYTVDAELLTEEYDVRVETSAISWIEDFEQRKEAEQNGRQQRIAAYRERKAEAVAKFEEEKRKQAEEEEERRLKQMQEDEERKEQERLEEERLEIEKERAELERLGKEMMEREKHEMERIRNERMEKEKAEKEKIEREKAEQIRMEQINMARLTREVREKISDVEETPTELNPIETPDKAEEAEVETSKNTEEISLSLNATQATGNDKPAANDSNNTSIAVADSNHSSFDKMSFSADTITDATHISVDVPSTSDIISSSVLPTSPSNLIVQLNTETNSVSTTTTITSPPAANNITKVPPIDYADFEADRNDPFDSTALKSINDMEELAKVLQPVQVSAGNVPNNSSDISSSSNIGIHGAVVSGIHSNTGIGIIPGVFSALTNYPPVYSGANQNSYFPSQFGAAATSLSSVHNPQTSQLPYPSNNQITDFRGYNTNSSQCYTNAGKTSTSAALNTASNIPTAYTNVYYPHNRAQSHSGTATHNRYDAYNYGLPNTTISGLVNPSIGSNSYSSSCVSTTVPSSSTRNTTPIIAGLSANITQSMVMHSQQHVIVPPSISSSNCSVATATGGNSGGGSGTTAQPTVQQAIEQKLATDYLSGGNQILQQQLLPNTFMHPQQLQPSGGCLLPPEPWSSTGPTGVDRQQQVANNPLQHRHQLPPTTRLDSAVLTAPSQRPDLEDFYSRYYGGLQRNAFVVGSHAGLQDDAGVGKHGSLRASRSVPDLTALEDQEVSKISSDSSNNNKKYQQFSALITSQRPSSTGPALNKPLLDRHQQQSSPTHNHTSTNTHTSPISNYSIVQQPQATTVSFPNATNFSSPTSPLSKQFNTTAAPVAQQQNFTPNNYCKTPPNGVTALNSNQNIYGNTSNTNNSSNIIASFPNTNSIATFPNNSISSYSNSCTNNSNSIPNFSNSKTSSSIATSFQNNNSNSFQNSSIINCSGSNSSFTNVNNSIPVNKTSSSFSSTSNCITTNNTSNIASFTNSSNNSSSTSSSSSNSASMGTQSSLQLPDPFTELDAEAQSVVCSVAEMGFPRDRVARAVQRLGTQHKKLIEVLLELQRMQESGEEAGRAELAFYAHLGDTDKTKLHLANTRQLVSLGFEESRVRELLLRHDNDRDKTLEDLIA